MTGGDGPWLVEILWILTGLIFVWVLLRIYTRAWILNSYGVDDHVFVLSFILFLIFTIFINLSAHYGYGQDIHQIDLDGTRKNALLYLTLGQTFQITNIALSKWCLGLFLLRLVVKTWQRVILWAIMGTLMAVGIVVVLLTWFRCMPPAFVYDQTIPGGYCHAKMMPASHLFTSYTVVVDVALAAFPWFFIWKLNIKFREKITILVSMSLGLFAAGCGVKRSLYVPTLSSPNVTKTTVPLILWAAIENAVTLICTAIPVCWPLYKRIYTLIWRNNRTRIREPGRDCRSTIRKSLSRPKKTTAGLSGTTLPAVPSKAWVSKLRRRKSESVPTTFAEPWDTEPGWMLGMDGLHEMFGTSMTTTVVGGSGEEWRDRGGDIGCGVTDEEAATGVFVTRGFEVTTSEPRPP